MPTLNQVKKRHKLLRSNAYNVIERKGRDYNRKQQKQGDTLFNVAAPKLLGVTDTKCQAVLVRLSDKFMRLSSLGCDPENGPAVKQEKLRDTVEDMINYLVYLELFYEEESKKK